MTEGTLVMRIQDGEFHPLLRKKREFKGYTEFGEERNEKKDDRCMPESADHNAFN